MIGFALFSKVPFLENDPLPSGTYPTHFLEIIPTGILIPPFTKAKMVSYSITRKKKKKTVCTHI